MKREVLTLKDINVSKGQGRITKGPAGSTVPVSKDEYFDRLLKYIPAEVVACYVFVLELVNQLSGQGEKNVAHWLIFLVFCVFTYGYLWRILHVRKIQQIIISVVAFVVWVFALGGPFALYAWYNPLYGAILLPVYTLAIAIWEAE